MPLFMDVHRSLPEQAGAEDIAGAHAADLRVQERYATRYLNYWFDPARRTIFCLVEAPDAASAVAVHRDAHGMVADEIYCVEQG
jgi:hypothetical protein